MVKILKYLLFLLLSCSKPDCDCGEITRSEPVGDKWVVFWVDDCGGEHMQEYGFEMSDWKVGDRVCELETLNIEP